MPRHISPRETINKKWRHVRVVEAKGQTARLCADKWLFESFLTIRGNWYSIPSIPKVLPPFRSSILLKLRTPAVYCRHRHHHPPHPLFLWIFTLFLSHSDIRKAIQRLSPRSHAPVFDWEAADRTRKSTTSNFNNISDSNRPVDRKRTLRPSSRAWAVKCIGS